MTDKELYYYNRQLRYFTPEEIVIWALERSPDCISTTSFGRQSSALIHLVNQINNKVPIIWCDTGYYAKSTYEFAESLRSRFNLNLKVYAPKLTRAFVDFKYDDPTKTFNNFDAFVETVKVEPLQRALEDHQPKIWFTHIREDQTSFRKKQNILSRTEEGILKVSPFYYCTDSEIKAYLTKYKLPANDEYYDVTKQRFGDECGIQLL